MTNKEFQEILKLYPDDYVICLDTGFGWNQPKSSDKVDPHLCVLSDFGEITIEPEEYPEMDKDTLKNVLWSVNDYLFNHLDGLKMCFNKEYE